MSPIVPAADPVGLPAPPGLLTALLVALLPLHLIPMNAALGGGLVAAWAAWRARHAAEFEERRHRALLASLATALPVVTAAAITMGVAPLLFLQTLYGPAFYTSAVLMAWFWLAVVALLMAGYYSYYALAFRRQSLPQRAGLALAGALLLLGVAFLFTNNMTLMLHPERWREMYVASAHGLHLNIADATLGPRLLHFLTASLAVTGLFVGLLGRQRRSDIGEWMQRLGTRLFTAATSSQLLLGLAFLLAQPEPVRKVFLGGSPRDTSILWSAVALAMLATLFARRRPVVAATLTLATIFGMSYVRHRVRVSMLTPSLTDGLDVHPQYGPMALFALLLLAGITTLAWMSVRFVRARPA